MRKLTVLLAFGLLSALPTLPIMAEQPPAPAAGPAEQALIVAAPLENGACAAKDPLVNADLAIFAPDPAYKTCGSITSPCARPAGAGPCKWNCPCPTYTSCTLVSSNGCTLCVSP